jgi:L-erythrulose 1-phosphate isomerase
VSSRPLYFGTNFKMHQTPAESAAFYRELAASAPTGGDVRLFMIPPATSLAAVSAEAQADPQQIWIGAQNMHWEPQGAYTGEISAPMLIALGVDLVLLGHAERRGHFSENDADLNRKVLAAVAAGLKVLLCVGETADERRYGVSHETVLKQLKIGLHGVEPADADKILIGYEPVWSIGEGGIPASPEDVAPIAATLRDALDRLFGSAAQQVPVLYGGSVNPGNAGAFVSLDGIDGCFVGRSAWTVEGYRATLAACMTARA